ncbi:glycosyltransferase [Pseudomonas duriflava]|nr:glycosyltransferase [Pseudomonas duriflava]
MTGKTTVLTVTYGNRMDYLEQLVERSLAYEQIDRVIIVSNASSAPLQQLTERWHDQVMLISLKANTGSANGYAVAIEAALRTDATYFWMMDDDNAPTPQAVHLLHRHLEELSQRQGRNNVAVLGFRPTQQEDIAQGVPLRYIVQPRSSYFGFHVRQIPYKIWRRLPWGKPHGKPSKIVSLPFAPYGGMLAHRSLYERIGVPLRDLVLYVDDTEYTRRITAMGGSLHLLTEAVIEELENSWNTKARTRNIFETYLAGGSDFRAYYAARNQAWFDKNVWATSSWVYRLNRSVFFSLLHYFAHRNAKTARLALLKQAIQDGESGALGMSKTFPL